jgi:hypothetical protein
LQAPDIVDSIAAVDELATAVRTPRSHRNDRSYCTRRAFAVKGLKLLGYGGRRPY